MAFAFFRRRQKTVIIIMVVLMVSFLVGPQVMSRLGGKNRSKVELGRLRDGTKLMVTDLQNAGLDLEILDAVGINIQVGPGIGLLQVLQAHRMANIDPAVVYALLSKEAEPFGPVSEGEVNSLLAGRGIVDDTYRQVVSDLRSREITEKRFRQALQRLIQVHRAFTESQVTTPPSVAELEHFYFDLFDRIRIRYARSPADQFIDDVEIPQEQLAEQMDQQFDEFKGRVAGSFDDDNPLGFGYRVPNRVAVEYMLARGDLLERVVIPPERTLRAYFESHAGELTKHVPSGQTTEDGEPIMRTEPKSFGEARSEIIELLRRGEVGQRMMSIFQHASQYVREFDQRPVDGQTAYEYAAEKMRLPADGLLEILLTDVNIDEEASSDAMEMLAEKADIQGICYPLADSAGQPLSDQTPVTVVAESITLGEALAQIAQQLDQPPLTWVQCETLTGPDAILFATEPMSTFPIMPGKTDLVDQATLFRHPLLSKAAMWINGQPRNMLVTQAFEPSLFDAEALAAQPLSQRRFQDLEVLSPPGSTQPGGLLMWRISDVDPEHDPEQRSPEIDEDIIADIKTAAALVLAQQHAEDVMARARQSSLGKVAEDDDLELVKVDQFGRKVARQVGPFEVDWVWRGLEGLWLPTPETREAFTRAVFALTTDDDPDGGPVLAVIAVPSDRSVCVVELLEHLPASQEEYQASLPSMIAALQEMRSIRLTRTWFAFENIVERVGFEESER